MVVLCVYINTTTFIEKISKEHKRNQAPEKGAPQDKRGQIKQKFQKFH